MGTRLDFQTILVNLLGSENVYFQPPANVSMAYPAIVYSLFFRETKFADNVPYIRSKRYRVMVIDQDPDSLIPDAVAALPMSTYVRHFTLASLNHDIYDVYF